jgi:hypothetical protein
MRRAFGHLLEILGILAFVAGLPVLWVQIEFLRQIDRSAHGYADVYHQWPIWALMSLPVLAGLVLFGAGYRLVRTQRRRLRKRAPR